MINKGQMELSSLVRDGIDEILVRIIQFTNIHHNILTDNIRNSRQFGFAPKYVDVDDFARAVSIALAEYQKTKRLVFCDSRSIKFMAGGEFLLEPQIDLYAAELLESDFGGYIELQKDRMKENIANNRAACALFYHKLSLAHQAGSQVTDDPVGNQI